MHYDIIVTDLLAAAGDLLEGAPTQDSGQAADAYLAIVQAVEAAQRERADVATVLATPGHTQLLAAAQWPALESAELGTFRRTAAGGLAAGLEGVLFSPAGIAVQRVRAGFMSSPDTVHTPVAAWLAASGTGSTGCSGWNGARPAAWPAPRPATWRRRSAAGSATRPCPWPCWCWWPRSRSRCAGPSPAAPRSIRGRAHPVQR